MSTLQINSKKIYTFKVDYTKSLKELILEDAYGHSYSGEINNIDRNFKPPVKDHIKLVKAELVFVKEDDVERKVYKQLRLENPGIKSDRLWELIRMGSCKSVWLRVLVGILKTKQLKPANIYELLWFGRCFPEAQKEISIMGLGTIDVSRNVPVLGTIFELGTVRSFQFQPIDQFFKVGCLLGIIN